MFIINSILIVGQMIGKLNLVNPGNEGLSIAHNAFSLRICKKDDDWAKLKKEYSAKQIIKKVKIHI